MRELDDVDLEIIRLLLDDGRRPYSEIADTVDLSPPAVSDRVDRLQELGLIKRFTIDVDRESLSAAIPFHAQLTPRPKQVEEVFNALAGLDETERVFRLADGTIVVLVHLPTHNFHAWLDSAVDLDSVENIEAQPLTSSERNVGLRPDGFDLSCVVCENEVGRDGEFGRFDGEIKAFCCESCLGRYEDRFETHRQAAETGG